MFEGGGWEYSTVYLSNSQMLFSGHSLHIKEIAPRAYNKRGGDQVGGLWLGHVKCLSYVYAIFLLCGKRRHFHTHSSRLLIQFGKGCRSICSHIVRVFVWTDYSYF